MPTTTNRISLLPTRTWLEGAGEQQPNSERARESERRRWRETLRSRASSIVIPARKTHLSRLTGAMNTCLLGVEGLTSHWFAVIRLFFGHASLLGGSRYPRRRRSPMALIWDEIWEIFKENFLEKKYISLYQCWRTAVYVSRLGGELPDMKKELFALLLLAREWIQK